MTESNSQKKKILRLEASKITHALSAEYKKEASEKITAVLLSTQEYNKAKSIFVYTSTKNEPDTSFFIKTALSDQKEVFVPKCIKKGIMVPVKITENTVFEEGFMGISEPARYDESIFLSQIDLSVIPCVGAATSGKRLGHGGGFYDIFLNNTKTEKICLCFEALLFEDIPTDSHDILMDAVITENGFYKNIN